MINNYFTKFLLFVVLFGLILLQSFAQEEYTEGKEYWFGIPHVKMKQQEDYRGEYPVMLWISSKVDTKARVTEVSTGDSRTWDITANQSTIVPMGDFLMNKESEVIKDFGIHIEADAPVSCVLYLSYQWSGEAVRLIPVDWLGREYVTSNLYVDSTDELKPGQILIIATENDTKITYVPTFATKKVAKGATGSVTLQKGGTYLIEAKENPTYVQDWTSDITGTSIKATKNIAVISGHTKGAFPRYYTGVRSGYTHPYANFSRNMLAEMLWPLSLLGTEYISAPIQYINRERGLSGVADDKGDLIRFVAAYDNTEVYQMRPDGSSFKKIATMNYKGNWFNITNQEEAAFYRTSKPCLVAQYGKTWWNEPGMMGPIVAKDDGGDHPLNPYLCGQGMMLILAPADHWFGYANFRSPESMDNFLYITFKDRDRDSIFYDGTAVTQLWNSSIVQIPGTEYSYLTTTVGVGDHYLEAKNNAKFAAYAYGNWDQTKEGFAYGYPIGINYAIECKDSLYLNDTIINGNVQLKANTVDLSQNASCAAIYNVKLSKSYNYNFTPEGNFTQNDKTFSCNLNVINPRDSAYAQVTFLLRSGRTFSYDYSYSPLIITPNKKNCGIIKKDTEELYDFIVVNKSAKRTNVLKELKLQNGEQNFELHYNAADLPKTFAPGEEYLFKVTFKSSVAGNFKDSIGLTDTCGSYYSAEITAQVADEPQFNVNFNSDITLGELPLTVQFNDITTPTPTSWLWDFGDGTTSTIQNPSHIYNSIDSFDVKLIVSDGISTDSIVKEHFIQVNKPTDVIDANSELIAGVNNNLILRAISPNPTNNFINIDYQLLENDEIKIELYDYNGRKLKEQQVGFKASGNNTEQINVQQYGTGIYYLVISTSKGKINTSFTIIK